MKRFSTIALLLITTLLLIFITGCTGDSGSSSGSSSSGSAQSGGDTVSSEQSIEAPSDSGAAGSASAADQSSTGGAANSAAASAQTGDEERPTVYEQVIPEETQNTMNNLTGTWLSQTPLEDGSVSVVRFKIDNVSRFTITTGTIAPDGNATYYSRMGSYEIDGNNITFSATTGGEHHEIDNFEFRTGMDPGVFQYTFEENPELTQLVLTPVNEKAQQLTGAGPITLAKS